MFFKNVDAGSGHQYDHCFSALQYFHSGGGGGTLYNGLYGEAFWPKGVPFSRLEVHESVGISLVTNIVYENVEKSVLSVYNWPKTANRCILWPWKAQEKFLVFWCIQTFKPVHLQPLKGM